MRGPRGLVCVGPDVERRAARRQIKELEESVRDEVEDAVKFADESPKPVRPRRGACVPAARTQLLYAC